MILDYVIFGSATRPAGVMGEETLDQIRNRAEDLAAAVDEAVREVRASHGEVKFREPSSAAQERTS